MADIVLDANVIGGYLDVNDALHARSVAVFEQLESTGNTPLMETIFQNRGFAIVASAGPVS